MAEAGRPRLMGRGVAESSLGDVYRRAAELGRLRRHLARALAPDLALHLAGVSGDRNRLVLYSDSAAWATRLRYQAPVLERAAAAALGGRPQLAFRVLPPREAAKRPDETREVLPERSRAVLESAARTVGDEELAAALRRLARHR